MVLYVPVVSHGNSPSKCISMPLSGLAHPKHWRTNLHQGKTVRENRRFRRRRSFTCSSSLKSWCLVRGLHRGTTNVLVTLVQRRDHRSSHDFSQERAFRRTPWSGQTATRFTVRLLSYGSIWSKDRITRSELGIGDQSARCAVVGHGATAANPLPSMKTIGGRQNALAANHVLNDGD